MSQSLPQFSLSGGELAPSLFGMADLAFYRNSLKTQRNYVTKPYGGIVSRAGLKMVAETKSSGEARLIRFSFSTQQNYVAEFGAGYIRLVANGVQVTVGTPAAWVTNTDYLIGDVVEDGGVNYYCLVEHRSSVLFSSDTAKWVALTGDILEIPTSYTAADLRGLKYTQSADVLTVVHPDYPPMQLSRYSATRWTFQEQSLLLGPIGDINVDKTVSVTPSGSVGDITITATSAIFEDRHVGMLFYIEQKDLGQAWEPGKAINAHDVRRANGNYYEAQTTGTTGQNIPAGYEDSWDDGGVNWTYLHSGWGCAKITAVAVDGLSCDATVTSYMPNGSTDVGYSTPFAVSSISEEPVSGYTLCTVAGATPDVYGTGLVTISYPWGESDTVTEEVTANVYVIDATTIKVFLPYSTVIGWSGGFAATITYVAVPNVGTTAASYKWAFGTFGDPAIGGPGYPNSVCYYQQRLTFAGTYGAPDSIWLSRTNSYSDFSVTGTINILDSDTIARTIGANQVNAVRGLLPLNRLLVFTSGATWAMDSGSQSRGLTPAAADLVIQSYFGVADMPVLGVGTTTLYIEDKGKIVHDLNYQFASDNYVGEDLTAKAAHLTDGYRIVEWDFQRSPLSCAWMVRDDGTLLGLTYLKEQQVVAWHHHDTDGEFESVAVISEGDEDVVYVVVKRTINGSTKRFIERFATRKITSMVDAFCVDCGGTFDGRYQTGTTDLWDNTFELSGGTTWDDEDEILITMTAGTTNPFVGTKDVGDQIVYTSSDGAELRITITEYLSHTTAHGRPARTVPVGDRGVTISTWGWARNQITGADWLEGKTVSILGDGHVYEPQVVDGGTFSLTPPAMIVHFGLGYDCDFATLPLAPPQIQIRDRVANIQTVRILVSESAVLKCGSDYNSLYDQGGTRDVLDGWQAPNLVTDLIEIRVSSSWDNSTSFVSRHSEPTPIGILAIFPEVQIGGL